MWNGEIKTLNMNSGKIKLLASENDEAVECCQIEPTSLRAVTGGADGTVQGWNIINGKNKCFFTYFKIQIQVKACSPEIRVMIYIVWRQKMKKWRPPTAKE